MYKDINDYEVIVEILIDIFGEFRLHDENKGQISFDCPVCSYEIKGLDHGDGKHNLEINYKYRVYKCWSCAETHETHGSIFNLVKKYGTKKQIKDFLLLLPEESNDYKTKPYRKVELPKEFILFKSASKGLKITPEYKRAISYIRSRNITDEMIDKYDIGFCYRGPYENRIIIPSYDEEKKVNYFIGRSYLTKPRMKYKNPESQKEMIIWNQHLINWDEPVYIVEGVFDSIFLPNSIPMLGKFISERLFNFIYENAKKVIIVLDPDAWGDTEKLYHKLNCGKLFGKVYVIKLEGNKDIADLKGEINNHKIFQLD